MKFSEKYLSKVKSLIKPTDHFENLAKDGFLNEYINDFFYERYKEDAEFREKIMLLQIEYSTEPVDEITIEYLKTLSDSLTTFINKIDK